MDNGADYVLILNNDTLLDKNLILALIDSLNENVGIVAPKIYFAKGYEFHKDKYSEKEMGKIIWYAGGIMDWPNIIARHRGVDKVDKGQYEILEQTDFASGCCMLVKREVFEKLDYLMKNIFFTMKIMILVKGPKLQVLTLAISRMQLCGIKMPHQLEDQDLSFRIITLQGIG